MWVLVLTASLLIRSIVGSAEIESSNSRKLSRFEIGGRSNSEIRSKYVEGDVSRAWEDSMHAVQEQNETEPLPTENKQQRIPHKRPKLNETTKMRLTQISKRSEIVPKASWIYAAIENKIPGTEWSQKKRSSTFNPWGGKRIVLYRTGEGIRRPIRMPFNSWAGKRGKRIQEGDGELREKKSKDAVTRDDPRLLVEGYDVKRVAEDKSRWKVPFNSWGGKRSQSGTGQRNTIFTVNKENDPTEKAEALNEAQNTESSMEEKRAAQLKNAREFVRFNSWGGKRNNVDYQVLSTTHNEIGTDYEGQNEVDDNDWYIIL